MSLSDTYLRWLYRGGRPSRLAKVHNRIGAVVAATGIAPRWTASLEVPGRVSGRTVSLPVVIANLGGERYLVSMLGEKANWVANVHANRGRAVLRHGRREEIRLVEVEIGERAPILRRYLEVAPGARPHIPVDRRAPLAEIAEVAATIPVFRIEPAS